MKVVKISQEQNNDAIAVLESAIERVKTGDIESVALAWVGRSNSIGGEVSAGENTLMLWASLEHSARSFYETHVLGG